MSTRLYLDSARQPRTPDGSAGEWADFFDGAMELEAKNWPPLLWWAMFGRADLAEARIADTEDAGTVEHAELLEEWGEATYPYLVVDQPTALARLRARREALTGLLGERFAPLYDEFVALVDARFGPYVLLRTEALADGGEDGEGGLRRVFEETLADLEGLDAGRAPAAGGCLDDLVGYFRRWQHTDPVWLLAGAGRGWPSAGLRERLAVGAGAAGRPSAAGGRVRGALAGLVAGLVRRKG
ncbi:hypothetical protein [Streptomyces sp. CBMA156]|uniref:hypothetical protein n=1 Tax=Streptomyces sp. CBMA156 TaxID=1930280 RepID=UPI001661E18D|nr:hypothetical protein [Streptomyces sp. CBMA156]MBD0670916.1 hypothetical protein [Streptomyces sp. CBMA156]